MTLRYDLVIRNGAISVGGNHTEPVDIGISGGKVTSIAAAGSLAPAAEQVIEAKGLVALPGVVDEHVHMMDPGHTEREDFTTGTLAAAYGGVTFVMEHHRTEPPVYDVEELKRKRDYLAEKSVVDFGLKGGVAPDNRSELRKMWAEGITGFKLFTCGLHGAPAMLPGPLYYALKEIASFNGAALVHAEEDSLTKWAETELKAAGRKDYLSHFDWRSEMGEMYAIQDVLDTARLTGATVVFAHVSSPRLVELINKARGAGVRAYVETCPHYLFLSTEDLKAKGPWVKCAPSVRAPEDVVAMWRCLNDGLIHTIGSDHCPYPKEEKARGEGDIWEAPNGLPGVETSLRLLLTGVAQGKTTLERAMTVMSTNPARLWGLYPNKGRLGPGADADIVLVDLAAKETLQNDAVVSKCRWTPFEGLEVQGIPLHTLVRGKPVMLDRELIGKPGDGCFVPRRGSLLLANPHCLPETGVGVLG